MRGLLQEYRWGRPSAQGREGKHIYGHFLPISHTPARHVRGINQLRTAFCAANTQFIIPTYPPRISPPPPATDMLGAEASPLVCPGWAGAEDGVALMTIIRGSILFGL